MIMNQEIQVKIDSYILKLKNNLNKLPEVEKVDVVNEIKSHIFESISYGESSEKKLEEVLGKLGKPEEYAKLINEEYVAKLVKKGSFKDNFKNFLSSMKIPFILTLLLYISVMVLFNTFILYGNSLKEKASFFELIILNILGLPAILEILIPVSIFYSLPWAYYTIAKSYNSNRFIKSWKLWKLVLITGLLASSLSLVIGELIVPYSNNQSVEFMKVLIQQNNSTDKKENIVFSNEKSIQEMNFFQAKEFIEKKDHYNKKDKNKDKFSLYMKLSIYVYPIIISIFSVFIGILMTTEIFNNKYLVTVTGLFLPTFLYLNWTNLEQVQNPIFDAFKPNLILLGITSLILLGIFLKRENKVVL